MFTRAFRGGPGTTMPTAGGHLTTATSFGGHQHTTKSAAADAARGHSGPPAHNAFSHMPLSAHQTAPVASSSHFNGGVQMEIQPPPSSADNDDYFDLALVLLNPPSENVGISQAEAHLPVTHQQQHQQLVMRGGGSGNPHHLNPFGKPHASATTVHQQTAQTSSVPHSRASHPNPTVAASSSEMPSQSQLEAYMVQQRQSAGQLKPPLLTTSFMGIPAASADLSLQHDQRTLRQQIQQQQQQQQQHQEQQQQLQQELQQRMLNQDKQQKPGTTAALSEEFQKMDAAKRTEVYWVLHEKLVRPEYRSM